MKVLKFGGSSVADAKNINRVIDIIVESSNMDDDIVVVVSALGGITDNLVTLVSVASKKENKYKDLFDNICERHNQVIKELISSGDRKKLLEGALQKYNELREIIEKVFLTQDASPATRDLIISFGEQLSAYIMSEALRSRGIECDFVDARKIIKTDENFGEGNVNIKSSYKLISKYFSARGGSASGGNHKLSVMGGFIASTKSGRTTTLGRGGSDYTASLVGAALDASRVEIWTDVDGLMTADPRKIKNAVTIPEISYAKAEEMANSGAKVIHPKTMKPARLKNIPIYIKNTFNPKGSNTKISTKTSKKISNGKINTKIPVGILGATGMVGRRLLALLKNHPWFEVTVVAASRGSAGKKLGALTIYSALDDMDIISKKCRFVFSAINADNNFIKKIEESYAEAGLGVVSNNSAHRWTPDVPMIMPEINGEHLDIIPLQQKKRGWGRGFIVTKPNCSIQSYVPLLHTWRDFNPQKVIVSTYQSISGAGKTFKSWPEIVDNVIPLIEGEEEKSEREPQKIFAEIKKGKFYFKNKLQISSNCVRVPVTDGHMAAINIQFGKKVSKEKLIQALKNFKNPLDVLNLPSAPKPFLTYWREPDRPQTRLDRDLGNGMGISVGRIRPDTVLGWKCVALSHNTIRGAAGGSILTAELLAKKGYIS